MKTPVEILQILKEDKLIFANQAEKLEDLVAEGDELQSWQTIFASIHTSLVLVKPEWLFKYIDTPYEYIRIKAGGTGKIWNRFSKTLSNIIQYKNYVWHGKNTNFHEDGRIAYIRHYKNGDTFGNQGHFKYLKNEKA